MEFDRTKILTAVTADKSVIGKMGWLGDRKPVLENQVKTMPPLEIIDFDEDEHYAFKNAQGYVAVMFYPAPEPTYKERQTEWVMENKVDVGTKVRITRDFTPDEDGSTCILGTENVGKKKIVGEVGRVSGIYVDCVIVEVPVGNWRCPFTVLEVIDEPYRAFNNAEEFKPYRDEWICYNGITFKHEGYTEKGIIIDQEIIDWDTAFERYHFEKEVPFGVKKEV